MNGFKLNIDGKLGAYDINEKNFDYMFQALQKAIDCDCIDIVHAANLPEPYCLVVDDEALLKSKPCINLYASYLYGTLDHGQPICGDCIIMKDEITPDGVETVGLEQEDIDAIVDLLRKSKDEMISLHFRLASRYRGDEENENS